MRSTLIQVQRTAHAFLFVLRIPPGFTVFNMVVRRALGFFQDMPRSPARDREAHQLIKYVNKYVPGTWSDLSPE